MRWWLKFASLGFTNGDSHEYSDKVMICLAVINIKANFGNEDISFVLLLYDGIIYQMPVFGLGKHPYGFGASWKLKLGSHDE